MGQHPWCRGHSAGRGPCAHVSVYPRSSPSSFCDRGLRFSLLGGARAGKELCIFVAPPLSGGGESSLVYIRRWIHRQAGCGRKVEGDYEGDGGVGGGAWEA